MDEDLKLLLNPREADCKDVTDHSHEHTDHTHEHEHAHSKCSECCDDSHIYNKEQTEEEAPDLLFVQSTFDLSVIFEESSKDDWGKISEVIKSCLELKFTGNQVQNVTINEQTLHVDHNFSHVTAQDLVDALFGFCYEVTVITDGGVAEDHSHANSHQESAESLKEHSHSHEHSGDHDHDHW